LSLKSGKSDTCGVVILDAQISVLVISQQTVPVNKLLPQINSYNSLYRIIWFSVKIELTTSR